MFSIEFRFPHTHMHLSVRARDIGIAYDVGDMTHRYVGDMTDR